MGWCECAGAVSHRWLLGATGLIDLSVSVPRRRCVVFVGSPTKHPALLLVLVGVVPEMGEGGGARRAEGDKGRGGTCGGLGDCLPVPVHVENPHLAVGL